MKNKKTMLKASLADQFVNSAFNVYDARKDRRIAVVTGDKKPDLYKNDKEIIMLPCMNIVEASMFLQLENAGRLKLRRNTRFRKNEVVGQFAVEYRLDVSYAPTLSPRSDNHKYSEGPIAELLYLFDNQARCIVRNYEYVIYADCEIPIKDIRDAAAFTRKLERDAYQKKYGIFCIAENFAPTAYIPDYGIVYYDLELFYQLVTKEHANGPVESGSEDLAF